MLNRILVLGFTLLGGFSLLIQILTSQRSFWVFCSSGISLGRLCVFRNLPILSSQPNLLTYNCSQYSFIILFISAQLVVMNLLYFNNLDLLSFFLLVNLPKSLSILLLSQNQLLVLLIFLYWFSILYLCRNLYFLPSATFGFISCTFSSSLWYKISLLVFYINQQTFFLFSYKCLQL